MGTHEGEDDIEEYIEEGEQEYVSWDGEDEAGQDEEGNKVVSNKEEEDKEETTPERQLLVPYSTKANAFCDLGRKKIGKNEPCSPQKAFAFVEYGT